MTIIQISKLYAGYRTLKYGINYSAQDRYKGSEVMFFFLSWRFLPLRIRFVCLARN